LGKLNHVAIAVPDMDQAVSLYKNVLNANKVSEKVVILNFKKEFLKLFFSYALNKTKALPEHGVYTVFVG
jgi:catechol 2,3-dioxygenase-like lactoylglutathione lyase family enzyme